MSGDPWGRLRLLRLEAYGGGGPATGGAIGGSVGVPAGRRREFSVRVSRLAAALALCAGVVVVVLLGGPAGLSLLVVGTFMLVAPGLLLIDLLRVRDGLLGLVLAMMAGPVLWVLVSTVEVLAGRWEPRATVLCVAGLLGLMATALLLQVLRPDQAGETPRHRFRSHQHGQVVVVGTGRHRGAFPPPSSPVHRARRWRRP